MAERGRWRIECGAVAYRTASLTAAEAHEIAGKVFPPPAAAVLVAPSGTTWRRSGGEWRDGGGRTPVEWTIAADIEEPA